jgi:hypothetical protein
MTRQVMAPVTGRHTVAERNPETDLVRSLQGRSPTQIRSFLNVALVSSGSLPKAVSSRNPVVGHLSRGHGFRIRGVISAVGGVVLTAVVRAVAIGQRPVGRADSRSVSRRMRLLGPTMDLVTQLDVERSTQESR